MLKIPLDKALYNLFCVYAFLVPLEKILEHFLNIDTILKPYRLIVIIMALVFMIKMWRNPITLTDIRGDVFLYLAFFYGLLVSFYRMIVGSFNLAIFFNYVFQISLYLLAFAILKHIPLTVRQKINLFWCFTLGVLINSIYLFYRFYFLKMYTRETGFMDNANYVALAVVACMAFIGFPILKRNTTANIRNIFLLAFLLFIFVTAGSRTGLLVFTSTILMVFLFSTLRIKFYLFFGTGLFALWLFMRIDRTNLGSSTPLILIERLRAVNSGDDPRFPIWRGAIRASVESKFFGLGIGQFNARFPEFMREETNKHVLEFVNRGAHLGVHSNYLSMLVNFGAVGFLCYLLFLLQSFKKLWSKMTAVSDLAQKKLYQFSIILLVCLILFGLASEDFVSPVFWFLLAFSTKT